MLTIFLSLSLIASTPKQPKIEFESKEVAIVYEEQKVFYEIDTKKR